VAVTDRLTDTSIGATGKSYDNSLAESINGRHKTELIKARGPWLTVDQVEVATLEWVDSYNRRRLYEQCGYLPAVEYEALYYRHHGTRSIAEPSHQ
jgi:putative transposase